MNRFTGLYFVLIFLSFHYRVLAQNTQTIKFSKNSAGFYFFQIGSGGDSIVPHKSDRFYFLVGDSLKRIIIINVDNGKFVRTENDSILRLEFLPGMKYETLFEPQMEGNNKLQTSSAQFELKTRVNGACEFDKTKIRIRMIDTRKNSVMMENVFLFIN